MLVETGKELWSSEGLVGIDEFKKCDKQCLELQVTTLTQVRNNSENAKDVKRRSI